MRDYKIAIIVGSLRQDSINRRLANAVAKLGPENFLFDMVRIDDLPLYNEDDDEHQSGAVKRMKAHIASADGLMFVTPEYNRSIPGVLKNAIDHASRPRGESAWRDKPAGLIGASPGAMGTSMAQQHLRNILASLAVPTLTLPEVFIHAKEGFFDEAGSINAISKSLLHHWMARYVAWIIRHAT